jgi:SAM-dependent methyltransferase
MTTRAAGPANFAACAQLVPMVAGVEAELIDTFRNGGGVPYSSCPRFHEAIREMTGATFDATLVDVTLPMVPGIVARLEAGVRVADISTGSGHAVNVMAKAFPNSYFTGIDFSDDALAVGRAEAEEWGLANATFTEADAAKLSGEEKYDRTFLYSMSCQHCMTVSLAYGCTAFG